MKKGHAEIVRILIENGADVNIRDMIGMLPIHAAARIGWKLHTLTKWKTSVYFISYAFLLSFFIFR